MNVVTPSEDIVERIRTVAVFLGPYRNLTTLTASILHLHPGCQVLNHAGGRVFDAPDINFLLDPSVAKFARFCAFALSASQSGQRGQFGGSITLSHAFDSDLMRRVHGRRYGGLLMKSPVDSIVWKESLRVSNHLRDNRVDFGALLAANDKIRFLMPIRNPLDCAVSNISKGHSGLWRGIRRDDKREVLERVLAEIAWFHQLARSHGTDRFLSFFEYEVDEALLRRLAAFLQLAPDARWIDDALECFRLNAGYEHEPALLEWYRQRVRQLFAHDETLVRKLERFAR